jgi:anti-anti-sigma factor
MSLDLPKKAGAVLVIESQLENGVATIAFRGTADVESRPDLDALVKKIHEEALRLKVSKVVIDFRSLEFMNSSSFKIFVGWLATVQELPGDRQYRIHFLSNPSVHWQRRSLAALSCFAVDLVTIES